MSELLSVLFAVIVVLFILCCVILVHEFGHFLAAKLSGIKVDEFSIGFGPRLTSVMKGETRYSLRAIPAGGYVKMAGMLGIEGESDAGERNFLRAKWWKRGITLFAGIFANFLLAGCLFTVYFTSAEPALVLPHEPMAQAGFSSGDTFVSINGKPLNGSNEALLEKRLHAATLDSKGAGIHVVMRASSGATLSRTVHPELILYAYGTLPKKSKLSPQTAYIVHDIDGMPVHDGNPVALFRNSGLVTVTGTVEGGSATSLVTGTVDHVVASSESSEKIFESTNSAAWRVGYDEQIPGLALPKAAATGFLYVPSYLGETLTQLWHLIATNPSAINGPNGLTGPVGIAVIGVQQAKAGWISFLYFLGIVSTSVGLVNVLPIPFLDGGRILFLILELIRRKRLKPEHEALIYAMGLLLILILGTYITIGDIQRLPLLSKGN